MPVRRPSLIVAFLALLTALVPVTNLHAQATAARGGGFGGGGRFGGGGESTAAAQPTTATPAARGGGRGGVGFSSSEVPVLGSGPTCTVDATIYDVRLPVDKIGQLDVEALTRASTTAAAFEKALAALGESKPLYRANQSVRLSGDTITISAQTPYVTNSQITSTGQTVNSVSYTQIGTIFSIAGKAGANGSIELDMTIQVSTLSASGTPVLANLNAPMFRTAMMARKGPVEEKVPFVVVSVDAANVDAQGNAVAYIARITLGAPEIFIAQ